MVLTLPRRHRSSPPPAPSPQSPARSAMKGLFTAALLLAALAAVCLADEKYSDKYDSIDLDAILHNDRLLGQYKECLVGSDDHGCSQEGKALRRVFAEAISSNCAKCTDKQKSGAKKAMKYLYNEKPAVWKEISAKYDPDEKFFKEHPEYFS